MNINSNLKQELLVSAKRELKNPFANIEGKNPEVKLPELVDEVTLTTVNSSSFDKYVEEMENGKQGVADKFVKTLENFIGDFVKGLSAVTETEETEDVEETNNSEQANNKVGGSTHEINAFIQNIDQQIQNLNDQLRSLNSTLDDLYLEFQDAEKAGDKGLQESIINQIHKVNDELERLQLKCTLLRYERDAKISPESADLYSELSSIEKELYDLNVEQGQKMRAGYHNQQEYYQYEDKVHELNSRRIDLNNQLELRRVSSNMSGALTYLDNVKTEAEQLGDTKKAQEIEKQKQQAIELQNKIKENIKKQGDRQKLLENLVYEFNTANRKDNAEEIQAKIQPQIYKLDSVREQLDKELSSLYEQYYAILDGKDVSTQGSEATSSLNNNTQTTTSSTSTTSTTKLGLNEFELKSEKKPLEKKDDSKINFFQKHIISSSDSSKNKTVEPKIDRNISRIIDNLGSSKPELEDVIDAFDNAGKRADFNSINKVAKQLDVHFGSSAIRKALKNA